MWSPNLNKPFPELHTNTGKCIYLNVNADGCLDPRRLRSSLVLTKKTGCCKLFDPNKCFIDRKCSMKLNGKTKMKKVFITLLSSQEEWVYTTLKTKELQRKYFEVGCCIYIAEEDRTKSEWHLSAVMFSLRKSWSSLSLRISTSLIWENK